MYCLLYLAVRTVRFSDDSNSVFIYNILPILDPEIRIRVRKVMTNSRFPTQRIRMQGTSKFAAAFSFSHKTIN